MLTTEGCRRAMIDEDYADFIVEYEGDYNKIRNQFQTGCYHSIDYKYAIVHIPVDRITPTAILRYGYEPFPACFGLIDTTALEVSGITRLQNLPTFALRGQGILTGFVDTGIDYTNRIFRHADGTTKIVSIWDQTIEGENQTYPPGFYYGTEFTQEQINTALQSSEPEEIVPTVDEDGHGTFLAGITAGSADETNDFVGVVPYSDIVVVKLKQAKRYLRDFFAIPDNAVCYSESDIMMGIKYLVGVARALRRPIAICIGLGTNQGGHDGRGALSEYVSRLADENGIAIVAAGGNEGNRGHHYYGEIDRITGYSTVELNVGANESGFSMELWGESPNTYSIDILSPSGEYIPRIPARLDERREIHFVFEETVIFIDYKIVERETGDQLILARFKNPAEGIWRFRVYGSGDIALRFHIWLPMEHFITTGTFFTNPNPDTTITTPGNARIPITVTAYNHINQSIYINSSRGFTRDGLVKPELAAPGVEVYGPLPGNRFGRLSGSSVSAAITTGVAAMMLEWGIPRGNYTTMSSLEIKNFLIRGARRNPNNVYPSVEWGYGMLDIYNIFESLRVGMEY